jgi:O-acetyl-ADP-ribose deacetylase (regulator of RNase III)
MAGRLAFVNGDATAPQGKGNKIIAHICNDAGRWGAGFVVAVSRRWREPESEYRRWFAERATNDFRLGAVSLMKVGPDSWVANMVGQHDTRSRGTLPPIRYEAVEECLGVLAVRAAKLKASVHMPRIGCGLAGGSWERIEPLILRQLIEPGIDVTVYDFEGGSQRRTR